MLLGGPAVADPIPSHSVNKSCAPNRITVVEITLAGYPYGSVASIEGDQVPINTTTIVFITRADRPGSRFLGARGRFLGDNPTEADLPVVVLSGRVTHLTVRSHLTVP
ncbi:hypothetical protein BH24ACT9_BH24ACT9_06960 [soil metagenome]